MAAASNYDSLLQGVANAITGLGLTYNGTTVPVSIQKAPATREGQDEPVGFRVYPGEANPKRERIFWDSWWVWYTVCVEFTAPGNFDLTAHLDDYMAWKEAMGHVLADPGEPVPAQPLLECVESVAVMDETPVDGAALRQGWDFGLMRFVFKTVEDH